MQVDEPILNSHQQHRKVPIAPYPHTNRYSQWWIRGDIQFWCKSTFPKRLMILNTFSYPYWLFGTSTLWSSYWNPCLLSYCLIGLLLTVYGHSTHTPLWLFYQTDIYCKRCLLVCGFCFSSLNFHRVAFHLMKPNLLFFFIHWSQFWCFT